MNYDDVRKMIGYIAKDNYEDLVKALVSFENGIDDKKVLDKIYDEYMKNDNFNLLNDNFDNLLNGFTEPEEYKAEVKKKIHNDNISPDNGTVNMR